MKFRAIEKILPALKTKGKYGWVPAFALCLLVLLTALGVGVYIDGYVIHPPAQYTGLCHPPAQILGPNCVIVSTNTVTGQNGQVTTVTYTQTAGQVLYNLTGHK